MRFGTFLETKKTPDIFGMSALRRLCKIIHSTGTEVRALTRPVCDKETIRATALRTSVFDHCHVLANIHTSCPAVIISRLVTAHVQTDTLLLSVYFLKIKIKMHF